MTSNLGHRSDPYQCFTESDLALLMEKPLEYQAQTLDQRVRTIEKVWKRTFTELGIICLYVDEKRLWQYCYDPAGNRFTSFDAWIIDSAPLSRSYAYDAKAKIKILRDSGVPLERLAEVPRVNVITLSQLPPVLQRDEEVLADAQKLSEETFRAKMVSEHPEAHLEARKRVRWEFDQTAWEVVDEAVHRAMQKWECNQQAAIEGIFAEWLVADKGEVEASEIGQGAHA